MDIFHFISLAGGVAVFLYGMLIMGEGLQQATSDKMQSLLASLTSNLFKAVALGAIVTAVIQSSSATTVMVVGLVNSGIMALNQAVGVIMGANIGTTITAWILSLSGVEGDSFLLRLLNPSGFSPILAVVGIFLIFSKKDQRKSIGMIFFGFALLMMGMEVMAQSVAPLQESPKFTSLFLLFKNPLLGVLAGAVLTAIIQSSSASVGILQALASTGGVTWGAAIPIIMGQNIGTCITALLSGIGAKKNAKRAAILHLLFNSVGTVIAFAIFYLVHAFEHFDFLDAPVTVVGIATFHTAFNLVVTVILLPFHNQLVSLSKLIIPDRAPMETGALVTEHDEILQMLDPRFLESPGFALTKAFEAMKKMHQVCSQALITTASMLDDASNDKLAQVSDHEEVVDQFEDALQSYLLQISQQTLTNQEALELNIMMHTINDLERMSDHTVHVAELIVKQKKMGDSFSGAAKDELKIMLNAVIETITITGEYLQDQKRNRSADIEALEEIIDNLEIDLQDRHIERLKKGNCTVEAGFMYSDILAALERISDYCTNISFYFSDVMDGKYDRHLYKSRVQQNNSSFNESFAIYRDKYALPAVEGA